MSSKRFMCIDIGYGDEWYITDNGKKLSEMEIVNLLNNQQTEITELKEENERLRQFINKGRRLSVKEIIDNINENESLKKKIKELEKDNEELKDRLYDLKK